MVQKSEKKPSDKAKEPQPGDEWGDLDTETDQYAADPNLPSAEAVAPCLVILSGEQIGQIVPLRQGEQRLGRADDAEIPLRDGSVSRYHAKIVVDAHHRCEIIDLGSTNGILVNGARTLHSELKVGDRIQLGKTSILKFEYYGRTEENFHAHLFQAGTHDSLTSLYNRRYFEEHFSSDFRLATRHGEDLSVIVFDVDHFKRINDSQGHLAGDAALQKVSEIMRSRVRTEDVLARYGGDEFVLVLRHTPLEGAATLANDIHQRVQDAPISHANLVMRVTISAGVATQSPTMVYPSATALFDAADKALLRAKQLGRNRIEVVSSVPK